MEPIEFNGVKDLYRQKGNLEDANEAVRQLIPRGEFKKQVLYFTGHILNEDIIAFALRDLVKDTSKRGGELRTKYNIQPPATVDNFIKNVRDDAESLQVVLVANESNDLNEAEQKIYG